MTDQRTLLDQILKSVHGRLGSLDMPRLTLFPACVGKGYSGELMVVGRAANAWDDGFELQNAGTEEGRNQIIGTESAEDCPMAWVANDWRTTEAGRYNTARSPFWRVVQRVASGLGIDGREDWSSRIAWSNLYKVSPYEGGNPSEKLCDAQFDACGALLAHELRTYRPKRVLFITGWNWFNEFQNETAHKRGVELRFERVAETSGPVAAVGHVMFGSLAVVTRRPEGKSEDEYVESVLRILTPGGDVMSKEQQEQFETFSGYPWDGLSVDGWAKTDCPYGDRAWTHSPWDFRFKLIEGNLFMELDHRMTNNRTFGFDRAGLPLPEAMVESVYPWHP